MVVDGELEKRIHIFFKIYVFMQIKETKSAS